MAKRTTVKSGRTARKRTTSAKPSTGPKNRQQGRPRARKHAHLDRDRPGSRPAARPAGERAFRRVPTIWRRIAVARDPAFDSAVPAYLLDEHYWFLDWNTSFDELVAGPLGLKRIYSHAEEFIRALENLDEVYERSKRVFARGHAGG